MHAFPRHLTRRIERALVNGRVVNVVGPRQAGKTTMVRDLVRSSRYLTLDDETLRRAMEMDAYGQLSALRRETDPALPIAIDEVQRVPGVTLALKRIVDADSRPGQFLLTGSADIFTLGRALDSLAGRVQTLVLRPMSIAELAGAGPARILDAALDDDPLSALPRPVPASRSDVIDRMVRGGYPEIRVLDDRDRMDRYESYLDTIVERDVADLFPVRKPDALRRLMSQLASRTAQELNLSGLGSDVGLKHATLQDYLDALTRLGIVQLLGAWAAGPTGREVKRPKIHMMDTGIATAVRGEDLGSFAPPSDPTALGPILETFVFTELEKSLPYQDRRWRLYHYRDQRGHEIDIVAEAPGRRLALFEMKAAGEVHPRDFAHAEWFLGEKGPGAGYRGTIFVVYLGTQTVTFGPGRIALPLSTFWSFPDTDAAAV